jgi:hypothetical protein
MPIPATNPVTIGGTYDKIGLAGLTISGDGCADPGSDDVPPIHVGAALIRYRMRGDGVPEHSTRAADRVLINDNLATLAAEFPSVAALIPLLTAAVVEVFAARGLLP